MLFKKFIDSRAVLRYRAILELWKFAKLERWAANNFFFRRWVNVDGNSEEIDAIIIPVQEVIQGKESTVLPYQILQSIIEKASGHFILNHCPCRNGEDCKNYPHDFGCLFLGEAVRNVSEKIGTQTDMSAAMQHVDKALEMGLVPMIVHASFDAELIGVPYEKMLAICFCCDCCCTVRHQMRLGPSTFDDTIQRLPGLTVTIGENCSNCGDCYPKCPVQAIEFMDGHSVINQTLCKGCGLCAAICPNNAPQLRMDESTNMVEVLMARIRSRTEIGI